MWVVDADTVPQGCCSPEKRSMTWKVCDHPFLPRYAVAALLTVYDSMKGRERVQARIDGANRCRVARPCPSYELSARRC